MQFLELGMTNHEIAAKTESTVKEVTKNMSDMFKKAKVANRTELVRWWKGTNKNIEP